MRRRATMMVLGSALMLCAAPAVAQISKSDIVQTVLGSRPNKPAIWRGSSDRPSRWAVIWPPLLGS
jgi:hypothetical protein